MLGYFEPEAEIIVDYDASNLAIGCVLIKVQGGAERLIAYASCILRGA